MNPTTIGKRIRKYRKQKRWCQEEFAEKIDLSVTYTSMLERGERTPSLETFITIANVLNISPNLLLADVINAQYEIKSSELLDEISTLKPAERERIYSVIRSMIDFEKRK